MGVHDVGSLVLIGDRPRRKAGLVEKQRLETSTHWYWSATVCNGADRDVNRKVCQ
jgi:hypothetical protein